MQFVAKSAANFNLSFKARVKVYDPIPLSLTLFLNKLIFYHANKRTCNLDPGPQSSHLLWLYSLVCVGPCRKPRRQVFV